MSNQVFKNSTQRYFVAGKENLYKLSAAIAVTSGSPFALQYNTVVQDEIGSGLTYTGGKFKIVNESAIGVYTFDVNIQWAINGNSDREIWFEKNTELNKRSHNIILPSSTLLITSYASTTVNMNLDDELVIFLRQSAGGNISILGSDTATDFSNLTVTKLT